MVRPPLVAMWHYLSTLQITSDLGTPLLRIESTDIIASLVITAKDGKLSCWPSIGGQKHGIFIPYNIMPLRKRMRSQNGKVSKSKRHTSMCLHDTFFITKRAG